MMRRFAIIFLVLLIASQQAVFYATERGQSEYSIAIGSRELYGRLVVPEGVRKPPVAILIHGSGQWDFNSAFGGMNLFYDIAHGLAQHGIASIRFNKRYRQHPPLSSDATIFTETIYDVHYAIDFAHDHEDLGDVFLIGFSQGGIVAPHIAYSRPEVAGIISLAGSPRSFFEIVVSQSDFLRYMASVHGVPVPSFVSVEFVLRQVLAVDGNLLPRTFDTFNNIAAGLGFPIPFMRSMYDLSTPDIIDNVQIPFLILQGEEDLQILAEDCFVAWQNLLGYRKNATFILYPGLNHFFAPHAPELGFNQSRGQARVDGQVIEDIGNWINEIIQEKKTATEANRLRLRHWDRRVSLAI